MRANFYVALVHGNIDLTVYVPLYFGELKWYVVQSISVIQPRENLSAATLYVQVYRTLAASAYMR